MFLGVDGGGTKTALCLVTDDGDLAATLQAPSCYYLGHPEGTSLVEQVRSEDPAAFRVMFDKHAPAVWRFLKDLVDDPSFADEGVQGLRHPSGHGPLLALVPESAPKPAADKNRTHLDLRLEPGDDPDAIAAGIADRGGREMAFDWGDLPWRHFADPSGNEFCVLRAYA